MVSTATSTQAVVCVWNISPCFGGAHVAGICCGAVSTPPPPAPCLSIPLPLSRSQCLLLLCSQLPGSRNHESPASSRARSVCTKSHRVPLCAKPSFWCWARAWGALLYPSTPTCVSPFSLTWGVVISLAEQIRAVGDQGMHPCCRRMGMQCLL